MMLCPGNSRFGFEAELEQFVWLTRMKRKRTQEGNPSESRFPDSGVFLGIKIFFSNRGLPFNRLIVSCRLVFSNHTKCWRHSGDKILLSWLDSVGPIKFQGGLRSRSGMVQRNRGGSTRSGFQASKRHLPGVVVSIFRRFGFGSIFWALIISWVVLLGQEKLLPSP